MCRGGRHVGGGSSAISSGWIRAANTVWHEKRGIKDTAAAYEADILAYGNGCRQEKKAKVIAEKSRDFVNYLASIGVTFANEYVIYTQTNIDMLKQKTVWEIVTPELHPVVAKMIEAGVAAKCDSYEALAKHIGCPVDGLKADIEERNAVTRLPAEKRRDRFGRTV